MKTIKNVKIIMPHGMMGASSADGYLEAALRSIAIGASKDSEGEWAEKYGTLFENDVFMMHPYCWCDKEDCKWCSGDQPNFWYKKSGFTVSWYKYIGRGMEPNCNLTMKQVSEILENCLISIRHNP